MGYGFHEPVLGSEVVEYLITDRSGIYMDCTLGGGGHASRILENTNANAILVGIDADADALAYASERLSLFPNKHFRQTYYDQLEIVIYELGKYPVDGILFDLGVSSFQIDVDSRGFSYQSDGPLDMRMDQRQKLTAAHVLNTYSQKDLERIIKEYGEERHWRAIAREVVHRRSTAKITMTKELVDIVRGIVGERFLAKSLARVFQAIRIEVNQELIRLEAALQSAFKLLKMGGRLVVISYHSLEDRIVKQFFKQKRLDCICPPDFPVCMCEKVREMKLLTRKPVTPTPEEIRKNSRARSAKLRAAEKIVPFVKL